MSDLRNVMAYFVANYPHKDELSKARLTKMIYLADWKSALDRGRQITDIKWKFHNFGPYVDDVHRVALDDPAFRVEATTTMFGNRKEKIVLVDKQVDARLPSEEAGILDHVIEETKRLRFDPFIKLVYSTYPVLTGTRGYDLDLVRSAEAYRTIEELI